MVKQKKVETKTKKKVTKKVIPKKESNWELFNPKSAAIFLFACLITGIIVGYYFKII